MRSCTRNTLQISLEFSRVAASTSVPTKTIVPGNDASLQRGQEIILTRDLNTVELGIELERSSLLTRGISPNFPHHIMHTVKDHRQEAG